MPKGGQDGNKKDMRFAKLVPVVMGIARAGTKSDYTCDEAYEKSVALRDLIDSIPTNVTQSVPIDNAVPDVNLDGSYCCTTVVTNKGVWSWQEKQ
jgi:hypothetical protein